MNKKLWIRLLCGACLFCVPAVVHGWQSGRLKNQKPTPRTSDTIDSGSSTTEAASPSLVPAERDTARPERQIDPRYSKISWERNLSSALKTASDGNKLVVVDVYADWCGWCKKMDRSIYSDPRVASLSSDVVFLRVNADDRGEGRQFARDNHVTGLPTTIILNHKGSVVNKVGGYIASPDRFISMVESSLARR